MFGELPAAFLSEHRSIIEYLCPDTDICPSEVGLLFGSRHAQDVLSSETVRLFREGFFKYVIVSGGNTRNGVISEAQEIAQQLVVKGMPTRSIILEENATNTGENVRNTRAMMGRGMSDLFVIGKTYAKRRYAMTISAQWPEIRRVSCFDVNYFGIPKQDWYSHDEMRARVLNEFAKISEYVERGYLKEVQVKDRRFVL
jgi:uncharacterized SAM-binding protein YcdF (DUF218 family)